MSSPSPAAILPGAESLIYAELLLNIRQISVIAALDTPCNGTTKVELSTNGQQFILHHGGEIATLDLPGRVSPNTQVQGPTLGSKELSWRLPLAGAPAFGDAEMMQGFESPWSAKSLQADTEFICRACDEVIVRQGTFKTWKDLPSENWAEMMDFWHCHKPDSHDHDYDHESSGASGRSKNGDAENSMANRGYGANNKFSAISGVGFVDIMTFLFTNSDCTGIQAKYPTGQFSQDLTIICSSCLRYVGYIDQQADGMRLYKWTLKPSSMSSNLVSAQPSRLLAPGDSGSLSLPSCSMAISSQLSSIIATQCNSRFILVPLGWALPPLGFTTQASSQESWPFSDKLASQLPALSGTPQVKIPGSSSLVATVAASSSRTFMKLWVLTSGLRYSATKFSANEHMVEKPPLSSSIHAMKVFWKEVAEEEAINLMETSEEVALPVEAIKEVATCLRESALVLPPSARTFQKWDVGLLEKHGE